MPTVLITGATSGLGRHIAFELVRSGYVVLAHGRDRGRTDRLVAELRAEGGEAHGFVADLASLARVRRLAEEVAAAHPRLDVLVNNAGVGAGPRGAGREVSADGHELRLAVNYLAPVALTRALLPTLRASAPPASSTSARPARSPWTSTTRNSSGATAAYRRTAAASSRWRHIRSRWPRSWRGAVSR